jgi:hypothetical protein
MMSAGGRCHARDREHDHRDSVGLVHDLASCDVVELDHTPAAKSRRRGAARTRPHLDPRRANATRMDRQRAKIDPPR